MQSDSSVTTLDNSSGDEYYEDKQDNTSIRALKRTAEKANHEIENNGPQLKKKKQQRLVSVIDIPATIYNAFDDPLVIGTFKDDVIDGLEELVDYFKHLLPPQDLMEIRKETSMHIYGIQGIDTITVYDIYKMIGMLFILDLYPFSNIDHAFGKRGSLYSSSRINSAITIEEFRILHNGLKMPDGNTMYLFDKIEKATQRVANPSTCLSLDEMLRKFMGQYQFKHRMPSKPAKEGLKWFLLCCSQLKIHLYSHSMTMTSKQSMDYLKLGQWCMI